LMVVAAIALMSTGAALLAMGRRPQ
jgi:hypothetical protein